MFVSAYGGQFDGLLQNNTHEFIFNQKKHLGIEMSNPWINAIDVLKRYQSFVHSEDYSSADEHTDFKHFHAEMWGPFYSNEGERKKYTKKQKTKRQLQNMSKIKAIK